MWVHTKSNSKLDGRAEKGRWIGYDEQSKGSRIYWPEKGSVTVERSITFVPVVEVDDLEGEDKVSRKNSSSPWCRRASEKLLPWQRPIRAFNTHILHLHFFYETGPSLLGFYVPVF